MRLSGSLWLPKLDWLMGVHGIKAAVKRTPVGSGRRQPAGELDDGGVVPRKIPVQNCFMVGDSIA